MYRKNKSFILLLFASLVLLFSCSENNEFNPIQSGPFILESTELEGITVNELIILGDWIFAATSDGVYGKKTSSSNAKFISMGLKGNDVKDLHAFTISEMLASVINFKTQGDQESKIYKTSNGGKTWSLFESNFGGPDPQYKDGLSDFERIPGQPNHLYASGHRIVVKSEDRGKTWQTVWGEWGIFNQPTNKIALNPLLPDELWIGGQGAIEDGFLARIKNGQEADLWTDLVPNPTVVKEIVFDRDNPQSIYVGWEGELSKTTDNGKTWKTLIDRHQEAHFFFGIGISPSNSSTIFAGKWKKAADSQNLEIYYSGDKGETWNVAEFPQITQGGVWDLKVIKQGQRDRIYLGLDKGGIVEVTYNYVVSTLEGN